MSHRSSSRDGRLAGTSVVLAGILFAFLTVLPASGAFGAQSGDPAKLQAEVESLSGSLQRSRNAYDQASARAGRAGHQEASLVSRVAADRARLDGLRRSVRRDRESARRAGRSLARARETLATRLVEIYMAGSPRMGDLLLASGDYGQLASSSIYLEAIGNSDRALARRVADLREQRLAALRSARQASAEASSRLDQLEAETARVTAVRTEAEASATRFAAIEESRASEIGRLKDRIEKIEAREARKGASAAASFPGGPYSIPTYIVMCESGGNYAALNSSSGAGGAYQILPSTWEAYGGNGLPHLAPKAEQDRIAALIWANDGPGAWVCS